MKGTLFVYQYDAGTSLSIIGPNKECTTYTVKIKRQEILGS